MGSGVLSGWFLSGEYAWQGLEGDQEKCRALLPCGKTRLDLNYIIGEMIGELGVGVACQTPVRWKSLNGYRLGLLGAEVSPG